MSKVFIEVYKQLPNIKRKRQILLVNSKKELRNCGAFLAYYCELVGGIWWHLR